jgi:pyruvate ferredoxin oxidoreductase alpha subunit
MFVFESGNVAAAIGVKLARAQVIAAYPITPQTPLTEKLSVFVDAGELEAEYVAVESEHSALAVCIGATSTGARAFTATSANGLLYMSEQVHWTAGARLPMVMCVVNRGVGAPWSVWNDHQDSISQRDAGWIQIYAGSVQEAYDMVFAAFRIAEDEEVSLPCIVSYDGFILSHASEPVSTLSQDQVDAYLPPPGVTTRPQKAPAVRLSPMKTPSMPTLRVFVRSIKPIFTRRSTCLGRCSDTAMV